MPAEMGRFLEEEALRTRNPERALEAALYFASAGMTQRAKQLIDKAAEHLPKPDWATVRRKLKAEENPGLPHTWAYIARLAANQVEELPGIIQEIEKSPFFIELISNAKADLSHQHYRMQDGSRVNLDELAVMQSAYEGFLDFVERRPDATVTEKELEFRKLVSRAYRGKKNLPEKNQSHDPRLVPYFARLNLRQLEEAVQGAKKMRGGLERAAFANAAQGKADQAHDIVSGIIRRKHPQLDVSDARLLAAHLVVGIRQNALAALAHAVWRRSQTTTRP